MGNKSTIKKTWGDEKPQTKASNIIEDKVRYHSIKKKPKTKKQKLDHNHKYVKYLQWSPVLSLYERRDMYELHGHDYEDKIDKAIWSEDKITYKIERKCSICGKRKKPSHYVSREFKKFKEGYYVFDQNIWYDTGKWVIKQFFDHWGDPYIVKLNEETMEAEDIKLDKDAEIELTDDIKDFIGVDNG